MAKMEIIEIKWQKWKWTYRKKGGMIKSPEVDRKSPRNSSLAKNEAKGENTLCSGYGT